MLHTKRELAARWKVAPITINRYVTRGALAKPLYIGNKAVWSDEQVEAAEKVLFTDKTIIDNLIVA